MSGRWGMGEGYDGEVRDGVRNKWHDGQVDRSCCIQHTKKVLQKISLLKDSTHLFSEKRRLPTLPHCIAVPSAQAGLTSLFGMGRGGTLPLSPPDMGDMFIGYRLYYFLICCNTTESVCITAESFRAISSARLWRHRLYTCTLSTSSSTTTLMEF